MQEFDKHEIDRIRKEYQRIDSSSPISRYSYFNPVYFFILQERERRIVNCLLRHDISDLSNKKILDVGCGTGDQLQRFVHFGAKPTNLFGMDLMEQRIKIANEKYPNVNFTSGNAESLPYDNKQFDIVIQITCFSSVLKFDVRKQIAREMLRVLKDDGIIIWYDLRPHSVFNRFAKPLLHGFKRNGSVPTRAISKNEIKELFPKSKIEFEETGIYFRLASVSKYSRLLALVLTKIPFLRTHYLAVIKSP